MHDIKSTNILIVDDMHANLKLLVEMLKERGYTPRPARSGKLALQAASSNPPDLILLDITMPDMNGYEVCAQLKANKQLRDIPVIFLSALNETIDKVRAFQVGGVDFITKPFQIEEVEVRLKTHLKLRQTQQDLQKMLIEQVDAHEKLYRYQQQLEEMVKDQVQEIAASQMATIFALAKLAESRDDDTGQHLERVQKLCLLLATRLAERSPYKPLMNSSIIDVIYHASALHDIGKVGISDLILLKPERLTEDEFEVMKTHASLGAQTLKAVLQTYQGNSFLSTGIDIARSHHERWDGTGYPDGLAGEQIPLSARIMAIADVYDALRTKRCYKDSFSHAQSVEIIRAGAGTQFDPIVVKVFLEIEHEFEAVRNAVDSAEKVNSWPKEQPRGALATAC
jgi:putative two-component system response regulator